MHELARIVFMVRYSFYFIKSFNVGYRYLKNKKICVNLSYQSNPCSISFAFVFSRTVRIRLIKMSKMPKKLKKL